MAHRLLFPISRKGSFIFIFPQTGQHIPHPAFDGTVVDHWLEWKIDQTANASAVQVTYSTL